MRRLEKIAAVLLAILPGGYFPMPLCAAAGTREKCAAGRDAPEPYGPEDEGLTILFWNLENFFDWKDGGYGDADKEFSSRGSRHWTYRKFCAKRDAIAKSLLWIESDYGAFPDIFGFAEVENAGVVKSLIYGTLLRKYPLSFVHYDSPDRRGIDVGLIYNKKRLRLLDSRPVRVAGTGPGGDSLRTRDILLASFEVCPDESSAPPEKLVVMVCHFPSKYGGGSSGWKREAASAALKSCADSLMAAGDARYIAMGDFNDTPDSQDLAILTADAAAPAPFANISAGCVSRGEGSIRFNGKWQLIDMFFTGPAIGNAQTEVVSIPFLTTRDNVHPGERPFRTWSGPRYVGGVSDHRPIILFLDKSAL